MPPNSSQNNSYNLVCRACSKPLVQLEKQKIFWVQSNIRYFSKENFPLNLCHSCQSLNSLRNIDLQTAYDHYPLKARKLDLLARPAFSNLLRRLIQSGMDPDHRILDLGCGNGLFIEYLKSKGFKHTEGFDPYSESFTSEPQGRFDVIIANDVIEHFDDPQTMITFCRTHSNKTGFIYVGTTCTDQLDWDYLEKGLMLLHQPYHRFIFSQRRFQQIMIEGGFKIIKSYRRSYMDTIWPFANYRFLDELHRALENEMDRAFEPLSPLLFFKFPRLIWAAFLGYFWPPTDEPALVLQWSDQQASRISV